MKLSVLICQVTAANLIVSASSQLIALPPFLKNRLSPWLEAQNPIMNRPNIVLPPQSRDSAPSDDQSSGVMISDVIGKERSISIFAGFTRDVENISKRFEDGSQNATVLAPLNSEITGLPRKPWEDPREYAALGETAYHGSDGEDRANKNLRRFVEAHVVPQSPWREGQKVDTIGGSSLWLEEKDGKRRIQPGNIEVVNVANEVSNGEVWIVKGVVNYV